MAACLIFAGNMPFDLITTSFADNSEEPAPVEETLPEGTVPPEEEPEPEQPPEEKADETLPGDEEVPSDEEVQEEASSMLLADEMINPVTYHKMSKASVLAANGNPIIVTQGNTYYDVYYDNVPLGSLGPEDKKIDLTGGPVGNLSGGFYFTVVAGGSVNKPCDSNTHVTMLTCRTKSYKLSSVIGGGYISADAKSGTDASVTGSTVVTIKETLENPAISVIGGGYIETDASVSAKAEVTGDTHIVRDTGDVTKTVGLICGGGYTESTKASGSISINGDTCIDVKSGKITTIYGGSYTQSSRITANVENTNINVTGGEAKDIFGGCYSYSGAVNAVVGNANITIDGGVITNDIYGGGCSTFSSTSNTGAVKIIINGGTLKNIIGGGKIYSSALNSNAGNALIKNDVNITVNDGTITGFVQGGGFIHNGTGSQYTYIANVEGNTHITIKGGIFTSAYAVSSEFPTIIGGGSTYYAGGEAIVKGDTCIDIYGGQFETTDATQPIICGGGAFFKDLASSKQNGIYVKGNSTVRIHRGSFTAPILAGGETASATGKDASVHGTASLEILGGTIATLEKGAVDPSEICKLYVSGGSIGAIPEGVQPAFSPSEQIPVSLTEISLESLAGEPSALKEVSSLTLTGQDYGTQDLHTDKDGKLYLYLKDGTEVTEAIASGNTYKGSVKSPGSGSLTFGEYKAVSDMELLTQVIYSWNDATTLQAKIIPSDATFRNVKWEIVDGGGTDPALSDGKLTVKESGTIKLRATIEKGSSMDQPFTKEFMVEAVKADSPIINDGISFNSNTIYANGNPLLITKGSAGLNFYYDINMNSKLDSKDVWINLNDVDGFVPQLKATAITGFQFSSLPTVFGGGLNNIVDNTCITVLSGEIDQIYGGCNQTEKSNATFSVTDTAKINLFGGKMEAVYGGGYIYGEEKYSLQGTTQGRYLTGGVPPIRFSM